MIHRLAAAALLVGLLCASHSQAEVVDSSAAGFQVRSETVVRAAPAAVYRALVDRIGDWWDPEHTFSGSARNLSLKAEPGGCFCERLPGGGGVPHLVVVYASPGKELRLAGALGPLQTGGVAGSMAWKLSQAEAGTKVELTYSVGGYFPGGLVRMASPVDAVLAAQLARLKSYVETGSPESK
jgi:uncharacterized protein YndB with AHSA1/START domain